MGADVEALRARLLDLRQSFDQAFSEREVERAEATFALLAIRVGRERYALRLSDIGGLEADRTLTRVPSDHPELLGIAGVRGVVVAVFDLATLLDLPRPESPRWLVLAKGAPLAFAFSAFEGQLVVPAAAFASAEEGRAGRVRNVVRRVGFDGHGSDGGVESLPLIDIPALVAALDRRPRARGEYVG